MQTSVPGSQEEPLRKAATEGERRYEIVSLHSAKLSEQQYEARKLVQVWGPATLEMACRYLMMDDVHVTNQNDKDQQIERVRLLNAEISSMRSSTHEQVFSELGGSLEDASWWRPAARMNSRLRRVAARAPTRLFASDDEKLTPATAHVPQLDAPPPTAPPPPAPAPALSWGGVAAVSPAHAPAVAEAAVAVAAPAAGPAMAAPPAQGAASRELLPLEA